MIDLNTEYLGLKLRTPLVASASPLCKEVGNVLRLEDAGASAVVLHSLFEEQIQLEGHELDLRLEENAESFGEATSYFPEMQSYNLGPEPYLNHLRKVKESVDIPVIGSLNGVSTGGWVRYAQMMQDAGADAIELNIYYHPTDPATKSEKVEDLYYDLVRHVKANVRIPVAVKLGSQFTAFANVAKGLDDAGADALVVFNRFYQPDFDIEALEVVPNLVLSDSSELRLRLHWTAVLYKKIRADLAITGGVHTAEDVVKGMMAGARITMMTSALLRHGVSHLRKVENDLVEWMQEHEYDTVTSMRGSMSAQSVDDPNAFARANYMRVLSSYTLKAAGH